MALLSAKPDVYSLRVLADKLNLELRGDGCIVIDGIATLEEAQTGQLSFLASSNYLKYLTKTRASAVILNAAQAQEFGGNCLIAANPYVAFARLTQLFDITPCAEVGIHASAHIDADAEVHVSAAIAANVVIEAGVVIAEDAIIGANCFIGADVFIGARTRLYANVSIYHGVSIEYDSIIHSGAVIGADGFGFAPRKPDEPTALDTGLDLQGNPAQDPGRWVKIYQLGGVIIGHHVELGANTTIDRGALDNTVIGNGVKIDNQCQIAHNVTIGDNTAIAANTAIAGSAKIGENCTIAGCVGIVGHINITAGVHISGMTTVSKSITVAGSYSSSMPIMPTEVWRKNAVRIRQLDKMAKRLQRLDRNDKQ